MQLAQAIDAWGQAHQASLSASTQRDIDAIRAAVVEAGWADLPHNEVDNGIRRDVLDAAADTSGLSERAIDEFLNVVLGWSAKQQPAARPVTDDGLGPSGAFEETSSASAADSTTTTPSADEMGADAGTHAEVHDAVVVVDDVGPEAVAEGPADDDIAIEIGGADDDWVDYLAGAGDGKRAMAPENESGRGAMRVTTTEDNAAEDNAAEDNAAEDNAAEDNAAASSFFNAIGSSPAATDDLAAGHGAVTAAVPATGLPTAAPTGSAPPAATNGGAFSAASEGAGQPVRKSVDWITVTYFSIAAICFALVIYFYLTS